MIKRGVKAQSIIEFITLIGAALFFFTILILAVNYKISDKRYEDEDLRVRKIALEIQSELTLAKKATDGYKRTFYIPEKINGDDYELIHDIISNRVSIRTERIKAAYELVQVNGVLIKGNNNIEKRGGIVYLNE